MSTESNIQSIFFSKVSFGFRSRMKFGGSCADFDSGAEISKQIRELINFETNKCCGKQTNKKTKLKS